MTLVVVVSVVSFFIVSASDCIGCVVNVLRVLSYPKFNFSWSVVVV